MLWISNNISKNLAIQILILSVSLLYHTIVNKSRRKPCISSATCCGISSTRSVVYHQAAGNMHADAWWDTAPQGLMISTTASWWYTKPAAWIKKSDAFASDFLVGAGGFAITSTVSSRGSLRTNTSTAHALKTAVQAVFAPHTRWARASESTFNAPPAKKTSLRMSFLLT